MSGQESGQAGGAGPGPGGAEGEASGPGGGAASLFRARRLRLLYLTGVTVLVVALAYRLRTVLNPLLLSLLIAYVTDPVVKLLERRLRAPRTLAIAICFVAVGSSVAGLGIYLYARATHGAAEIVTRVSGGWQLQAPDPRTRAPRVEVEPLADRPVYGPEYVHEVSPQHAFIDIDGDGALQAGLEARLIADEDADDGFELAESARELGWRRVTGSLDRLREDILRRYRSLDRKTVDNAIEQLKANTRSLYDGVLTVWGWLTREVFGGLLTAFSYIVLVPVYTFFLLRGFDSIKGRIEGLLPGRYKVRIVDLTLKIDRACAAFFRGRFLMALGKGILTWVGLWLVGVDFALLIGCIAGALSIVPFLGPVVGFVLALVFSYSSSMPIMLIVWAAVVFVVIEVLEAMANPFVLGREVGLHPVTILIAFLAFGNLFGLFGVLLAVPLAAIAKILGSEFVLPELRALAAERPFEG